MRITVGTPFQQKKMLTHCKDASLSSITHTSVSIHPYYLKKKKKKTGLG